MNNTKKIGIVGARIFKNFKKIEALILKLKKRYGDVIVVSGGQPKGADGHAKLAALNNNIKYVEFPPKHNKYNKHCVLDETQYSQPYKVTNYFERNRQIAEYSDVVFAFIPDGHQSNGTMNTIKHCKELNVPYRILNEKD